jgi:hypothetical protein
MPCHSRGAPLKTYRVLQDFSVFNKHALETSYVLPAMIALTLKGQWHVYLRVHPGVHYILKRTRRSAVSMAAPAGKLPLIDFSFRQDCTQLVGNNRAYFDHQILYLQCFSHGNCYINNAVCCDNPSVRCSVGTLCNACQAGQACGTGATSCLSGGQPPPIATSTNGKTTTTKGQVPPPTTTEPNAQPTPTIVQTTGDFKYQGCYDDNTNNRTLLVDSKTDSGASGMTVEKCTAFASSLGLRYAGVEFGSECHVGNTIHSNTKNSDGDCSQVCAGSNTETCGAGNRIQVYVNTKWSDPTLDELTNVLTQYNSSLFEARQLTDQYKTLISQWAAQQASTKRRGLFGSLRKRQDSSSTSRLQKGLTQVAQRLAVEQSILAQAANDGSELYEEASENDLGRNPFVDQPTLNNAQDLFSVPLDPLRRVQSSISSDLSTISEAGSEVPLLNPASDLAVIDSAAAAIGTTNGAKTLAQLAASGLGIFALIARVFLHLHPEAGDTGNPHSTTTITATKSTSTSTTSSSAACTATAGPLQDWLVMTSFNTSSDQFRDILADFKDAGVVITRTVEYDDLNWRFFTAPLNQCHAKLLQNPLIIGSFPNTELLKENPASEQDLDLRDLHVNATFEPIKDSSISKRAPDDYYVQTGIGGVTPSTCPFHLQDLSDPWAKPLTPGSSKFSI